MRYLLHSTTELTESSPVGLLARGRLLLPFGTAARFISRLLRADRFAESILIDSIEFTIIDDRTGEVTRMAY